jgi:hypothetical protein
MICKNVLEIILLIISMFFYWVQPVIRIKYTGLLLILIDLLVKYLHLL